MKAFTLKLLLLITVLVMSSGDVFAQVNWTKYSGNPIMTGPSGSWNRNLGMPCVLYNADSSRYEMWFAGGAVSGDRPYQIGFAVSGDGISWTMHPTPVLIPTVGKWDSFTVERPFVIRENGQYTMWYLGGTDLPEKVGYATSPDGINWTKLEDPVFEAGTEPWEAGGVMSGCIMPSTGGYKMWYSGYTTAVANGNICLGYATSPDGISWQRNPINNPVLEPGNPGEWDDTHLFFPLVLTKDNLYYMWYTGSDSPFGLSQVGLATSSDGIIDWEKHERNPVLSPTPGQWDGERIEGGSVILVGDTLYMWYSATDGSMWQIGLAMSAPFVPVSVEQETTLPTAFALEQNFPNPFNPSTKIKYSIPEVSKVKLTLFNLLGEEVTILANEEKIAGNYAVEFNAANLPSGVYFYQLKAGDFVQTMKMVLLK